LSHHRMIERSIFDRAETGNTRTSRTFHAKVRADWFLLLRWCRSHSSDENLLKIKK
jgi:hypothetical protein